MFKKEHLYIICFICFFKNIVFYILRLICYFSRLICHDLFLKITLDLIFLSGICFMLNQLLFTGLIVFMLNYQVF